MAQCIVIGPVCGFVTAGGWAVSEPYYNHRAHSVCFSLECFFFILFVFFSHFFVYLEHLVVIYCDLLL